MTTDEIVKMLEDSGFEASDLDAWVHDAKSKEASSINNEGMDSQVTYLMMQGYTPKELLQELKGLPN